MSTAILKTEVQARIDALTYPVDATVLLQSAVDTVGLDLDLTNITSVLNSSTAAIDTNTPNDDVTALNAASIALGVTSKGGGQKLFRFVDAGGANLAAGASVTIACAENERVVITGLESSLSGGTSDWSLSTGSRVVFNQGDIIVDDGNPALQLGGRMVVSRGDNGFSSGYLTLDVGGDVVIANLHASAFLRVAYQIEQAYEG